MKTYLEALKKYQDFSGRATRNEFWYFMLFNALVGLGVTIVDLVIGTYSEQAGIGLLSGLYWFAAIVPGLAVTVRRLQDSGRSGLWVLIWFVPLIGLIIMIIFMLLKTQPGANKYDGLPTAADATGTPVRA